MAELSQESVDQLNITLENLTTLLRSGAIGGSQSGKTSGSDAGLTARYKAMMDPFGSAISAASRYLKDSIPKLGNFVDAFGQVLGKGAQETMSAMAGPIDDQAESFRQLSAAGTDFGGSIWEMRLQTAEAGTTQRALAKAIDDSSVALATFGTTTMGANVLVAASSDVQAKHSKKLLELGYSVEDITANQASYMEQMALTGATLNMTDDGLDKMIRGSAQYNIELDRMSKATGLNRKQIDEANKAAARDARLRLATQKMSVEERTAFNAKIEQLKQMDPTGNLAKGFQDLVASGGKALTKEAQMLVLAGNQAGADFTGAAKMLYNGVEGGAQASEAAFAKMGEAASNMTDAERDFTASTMSLGVMTPKSFQAYSTALAGTAGQMGKAQMEQNEIYAQNVAESQRKTLLAQKAALDTQNEFAKGMIQTGIPDTAEGFFLRATEVSKALATAFEGANDIAQEGIGPLVEFLKAIRDSTGGLIEGTQSLEEIPNIIKAKIAEIKAARVPSEPEVKPEDAAKTAEERDIARANTVRQMAEAARETRSNMFDKPQETATDLITGVPGLFTDLLSVGDMLISGDLPEEFKEKPKEETTPATTPTPNPVESINNILNDEKLKSNDKQSSAPATPTTKDVSLKTPGSNSENIIQTASSGFKDFDGPSMKTLQTAMTDMSSKLLPSTTVSTEESKGKEAVAESTKGITGGTANDEMVAGINQLNTQLAALLNKQDQSNRYQGKILKASKESLMG